MNQIKIKTSLIIACGLVLTALPSAFAESKPGKSTGEGMFETSDTNKDGKVSRAEYLAGEKKMFAEMDANHDGTVNLSEITAAQATAKSGMVSDRPGTTDRTRTNDQVGTNERIGPNDRNVNLDRTMKTDRSGMNEMSPAAVLKMHDKNSDGQMSAAEHSAGCEDMFTKLDTNNDGSLSKEEIKAGDKPMKSGY